MQTECCRCGVWHICFPPEQQNRVRVMQVTRQEGKASRAYEFNKPERDENFFEVLFVVISASEAHACSCFKGRRIYMGYSWS